MIVPSGSLDPDESNMTVMGAVPDVTSGTNAATGDWFTGAEVTVIVVDSPSVAPALSVTVRVTTWAPGVVNVWDGAAEAEVPPSPKSQA